MNSNRAWEPVAREPVRTGNTLVHTQEDRDLAVAQWLLAASPDAASARVEWAETGSTALRCGGLFTTVSLPELIVHAAAGTTAPEHVVPFLRASICGPVFFDSVTGRYHALVPPSTIRVWPPVPDAVCATLGTLVNVPAPGQTRCGRGRTRWVVSMEGPGTLCSPRDVALVALAGHAQTLRFEGVGHE